MYPLGGSFDTSYNFSWLIIWKKISGHLFFNFLCKKWIFQCCPIMFIGVHIWIQFNLLYQSMIQYSFSFSCRIVFEMFKDIYIYISKRHLTSTAVWTHWTSIFTTWRCFHTRSSFSIFGFENKIFEKHANKFFFYKF